MYVKKIERSDSTKLQSAICNLQFRLAGLGITSYTTRNDKHGEG
ncbi:hypothetical protein D1AOALGA4SA_9773 [Olavius algarvensis Delta 1 endosymbiont]|nr:hypothetical protein D1AOALGA4SA_9773 [Olavius algarvensis Delta 1 endosymbiont]